MRIRVLRLVSSSQSSSFLDSENSQRPEGFRLAPGIAPSAAIRETHWRLSPVRRTTSPIVFITVKCKLGNGELTSCPKHDPKAIYDHPAGPTGYRQNTSPDGKAAPPITLLKDPG